jgi:hypothetical protein
MLKIFVRGPPGKEIVNLAIKPFVRKIYNFSKICYRLLSFSLIVSEIFTPK